MTQTTRTLSLSRRDKPGTTGANAARREGNVPGVLYGHGQPPVPVSMNAKTLSDLIHGSKKTDLIDIELDGTKDTAMVRSLQRDPLSRRVISADLQRVSKSEMVHATLQIITVGVAKGVKDSGGVLDIVTHEVDVMCPADQVPDAIRVDVSHLGIHHHVSAKDLVLPAGFKLSTPPDTTIVAVAASKTEKQSEADLSQAEPAPVAPPAEAAKA